MVASVFEELAPLCDWGSIISLGLLSSGDERELQCNGKLLYTGLFHTPEPTSQKGEAFKFSLIFQPINQNERSCSCTTIFRRLDPSRCRWNHRCFH